MIRTAAATVAAAALVAAGVGADAATAELRGVVVEVPLDAIACVELVDRATGERARYCRSDPAPAPPPATAATPGDAAVACPDGAVCAGPGELGLLVAGQDAVPPGTTIRLRPGVYDDYLYVTVAGLSLAGLDPDDRPVFDGEPVARAHGKLPAGRAVVVAAPGLDLTLEGVEIRNARGPEGNEGCVEGGPGGRITLRRVYCHDASNGVQDSGTDWLIEDSVFEAVGNPGAPFGTHGIYVQPATSLVLRDTRVEDVRHYTAVQVLGAPDARIEIDGGYFAGLNGHTLNLETCAAARIADATVHKPANPDDNAVLIRAECETAVEGGTLSHDTARAYLTGAGPAVLGADVKVQDGVALEGGWRRAQADDGG